MSFSLSKHLTVALALALAVTSQSTRAQSSAKPAKALVYVGTYTGGDSEGIYVCELDLQKGELKSLGVAGKSVAGKIQNPSFLALHPNHRFLYAVSEVNNAAGKKQGAVAALAIDPSDGQLTLLNQESSAGKGPCHLVVDREGRNVLVANYGSGSVAVLPIDKNGRLKPPSSEAQHTGRSASPDRQEGPHAHCVTLDAENHFAFVADLGIDQIVGYEFDSAAGTIKPNGEKHAALPPGAGPRHFVFHPNGQFAYVINELNSTITAFAYDAKHGKLESLQTVGTLPTGVTVSNTTAEIQIHPSGKFLYGSNRGHDSIAAYAIDAKTGRLTLLRHHPSGGRTPRNFAIDPTGGFLLAAHQDSGTIIVHRIDAETGRLEKTDHQAEIPMPVCVEFLVR